MAQILEMRFGHPIPSLRKGQFDLGIELFEIGANRRIDVGQLLIELRRTASTTAEHGTSRRGWWIEFGVQLLDVRALQRPAIDVDLRASRQLGKDSVTDVAQQLRNRVIAVLGLR